MKGITFAIASVHLCMAHLALIISGADSTVEKRADKPPPHIKLPDVLRDIAGPGQLDAWKAAGYEDDVEKWPEGPGFEVSDIDKHLVSFDKCNMAMKNKIINSYWSVWRLLETALKDGDDFKIDWNRPAAVEMFGSTARTKKYHDTILANFKSVVKFYFKQDIKETLWVRCDDPQEKCSTRDPDTLAYVPIYDPSRNDNMYVNFCPSFRWTKSLNSLVGKPGQVIDPGRNLDDWHNAGKTFLHVIFHLPHVSTAHRDLKEYYPENEVLQILDVTVKDNDRYSSGVPARTPFLVRLLANGGNQQPAVFPSSNAESYAQYLLAEFAHKIEGYYPFMPVLENSWPWTRECDGEIGPGGVDENAGDDDEGLPREFTKEEAVEVCKASNGTVALFFNNGSTILNPGECLGIIGPDAFIFDPAFAPPMPPPPIPDR